MIEKAYIGCLVSYGRHTGEMLAAVDRQDLSETAARVYDAVQLLHEQGRQTDPVVVIETAGEDVRAYLTECLTRAELEHAGAWQEHARLITERAQLQKAQALGLRILEAPSLDEARRGAAGLEDVLRDRNRHDELGVMQCVRGVLEGMDERPDTVTTGFASLDRHLMVSPGDFIVVGGRPSSGKTALTLQMAEHMAKTRRVVYFSLETGPQKLTERLLASCAGLELERIKRRDVMQDDAAWRRLSSAARLLSQRQLVFVRAAGYDAGRIAAKAQQLRAEVIFVDYLGLVQSSGRDRYEKVTAVSVALHTFAQRSGTAVFALSQLNREGASGRPQLHDLRESGQIEQDADAVLLLDFRGARQEPQTTEYIVDVAKNKDGRTGGLPFRFYAETQRFYAEDRG